MGFALPCRQNCVRDGQMMRRRGVACNDPVDGRVSIEIMYPKPYSNKRSDGWCATTISSVISGRDPAADDRSEPAFLDAVPNAVVFKAVGHRLSTLPLSPSLASRRSVARKSLTVSSTTTPAPPCWSWALGCVRDCANGGVDFRARVHLGLPRGAEAGRTTVPVAAALIILGNALWTDREKRRALFGKYAAARTTTARWSGNSIDSRGRVDFRVGTPRRAAPPRPSQQGSSDGFGAGPLCKMSKAL
jgi:hypothetical protein